jgi:tRNA A37 threonylcarbamoyladenosine synthetase subunit TsaC/SUA5/YrdC
LDSNKAKKKLAKTKNKKRKRTALIICRDHQQFWTTQTQFWQWVRESVVTKTGDGPLTGVFVRENEELMVVLSNTVLNLAHPNHLREALLARRIGMGR